MPQVINERLTKVLSLPRVKGFFFSKTNLEEKKETFTINLTFGNDTFEDVEVTVELGGGSNYITHLNFNGYKHSISLKCYKGTLKRGVAEYFKIEDL